MCTALANAAEDKKRAQITNMLHMVKIITKVMQEVRFVQIWKCVTRTICLDVKRQDATHENKEWNKHRYMICQGNFLFLVSENQTVSEHAEYPHAHCSTLINYEHSLKNDLNFALSLDHVMLPFKNGLTIANSYWIVLCKKKKNVLVLKYEDLFLYNQWFRWGWWQYRESLWKKINNKNK